LPPRAQKPAKHPPVPKARPRQPNYPPPLRPPLAKGDDEETDDSADSWTKRNVPPWKRRRS
jgi:hypothetical protein